jgi:hypothetical protein
MHTHTHTHTHVSTKWVVFCTKLSTSSATLDALRIERRHAPILDMSKACKLSTYE